ncbi:MAG: cellulase family glycosylhydrolase [Paludibacteraceae bacterium]|nr:cellulase family glycosylhydrolase [Paludibacteraceae bacterium]
MFKFTKFFVACLMLLISTAMAKADYPENSPVALNGRLKVEDGKMVNACGHPTQLRGMSTHGLAWNPNAYTEASIKMLVEEWNISLFRIAVYTHEWGGYSTDQWKTKEQYHELIDNLVDICGKYGIYCLIDWHVLNSVSHDPNNTIDDATIFFEHMSKTHKDKAHVMYEICNEPNKNVTWAMIKNYANDIIPVIRENDKDAIIVCGTPTWSQDVDAAAELPLDFDNVMYTLHFYSGTHTSYLRQKAEKAISKGLAIFVTEFGVSKADGSGGVFLDEADTWMEWMDKHDISWANWSFCDKNETSAALVANSISKGTWTPSKSGEYIKSKLAEPYKEKFVPCTDDVKNINNNVEITLYPNPTDGSFSINAAFDIEKVVILDMTGKEIKRFDSTANNYVVSDIANGIYQVVVYSHDFTTIERMIKK